MKILVYNRHFFPSIGGTEISGRIMARELAAIGHVVTVVTATPLPSSLAELDEGFTVVRTEKISRIVQLAWKHDVVFSRGGVSLRAYLAAAFARMPFVSFHEFDATEGRAGGGIRRIATDAAKALLHRRACLNVVVSEAIKGKLTPPARAKAFKLYNPVSEDLWTAVPLRNGLRDTDILFVGRLVPDKGLLVLRDALQSLTRSEKLQIGIAGSCDDLSIWETAFQDVCGEVTFLGSVSGRQLRDLYARSRILVMPTLVNEGMGMVAAEALANGTPVCSSDQPALREVVGDAGLFHRVGDANQLAAHFDRLLDDGELWSTLSNRAKKQRLAFSMGEYRKNLTAMIDNLGRSIKLKRTGGRSKILPAAGK